MYITLYILPMEVIGYTISSIQHNRDNLYWKLATKIADMLETCVLFIGQALSILYVRNDICMQRASLAKWTKPHNVT